MKLEQIMFHFYLIIVYYFKQYSHYWSLDIWAINMKLPGTLMDLEYILILCVIFLNYKWEFNLVQVSLITYWKQKKNCQCRKIRNILLLVLTDAFELWCWRRLLRVPWTAWRSNQSILKDISPGCSLEGLMLRLKLQYFGHLMWRVDSLEKTLILGGIGGRKRRGQQRMRWLDDKLHGHEFEWTPGVGDG